MVCRGLTVVVLLALASGALAGKWWENAVIYQIYTPSFYDSNGDGIGDLRGIEEKADYLAGLGVGAVWLSPFYKSPEVDNGYDVSDFSNIETKYGTMADFENMLKTLREKYGIEIIIDFILNHTSNQHEWFKKSVTKEGAYTDYYIWKDPKEYVGGKPVPPNEWKTAPMFGGTSSWEWNEDRKQFYYHAYHKEQPDLNLRNSNVIREFTDLFHFWLAKGVKGFRVGAVSYMFEDENMREESYYGQHTQSQAESYDLIEDIRAFLDEYGEKNNVDVLLMTEANGKPDMVFKYYGTSGSPGAHIPFNFLLLTHLKQDTNAHGLNDTVAGYLGSLTLSQMPNWVSGNHDMVRIPSRVGSGTAVDIVNMLNILLPGSSTVYYGDEIGMDSYWNMDKSGLTKILQEDYRTPHRTPFQWSDEKNAGFTTNDSPWLPVHPDYYRVNVVMQSKSPRKSEETTHLRNFKKLVELKKLNLALRKGKVSTYVLDEYVFAFVRVHGKAMCLVIVNLSQSQSKPINLLNNIPVARRAKLVGIEVKSVNMPRDLTKTQLFPGDFTLPPKSGLVLSFRLSASSEISDDEDPSESFGEPSSVNEDPTVVSQSLVTRMIPFPLPPGPPPFMPWMSGPPMFGLMGMPWPPPPPPPFMMPFGGPPRGGKGVHHRPQWPPPPRLQNQQRPNGQNPRKPVDLYHNLISSPSRGVRLAAKLIGVPLNLKSVDLAKQEQMEPSFLRMNPQHTVPTMDDNGFYLSESRAIITYLANKYGKHKKYLYPKDPERRGVIDQRLYFDMGTLFQRFADYWMPYMFAGVPLDQAKLKKLEEAFKFFDDMLKGSVYAAGDRITVADAALASSVSTIEAVGMIDVGNYPNVSRWYKNVKNAIPDYENTNQKGALAFNEFSNAMISKWKNA